MSRKFHLALTGFTFRVSPGNLFRFGLILPSGKGMEEPADSLPAPSPQHLKATSSWGHRRTMPPNIRAVWLAVFIRSCLIPLSNDSGVSKPPSVMAFFQL